MRKVQSESGRVRLAGRWERGGWAARTGAAAFTAATIVAVVAGCGTNEAAEPAATTATGVEAATPASKAASASTDSQTSAAAEAAMASSAAAQASADALAAAEAASAQAAAEAAQAAAEEAAQAAAAAMAPQVPQGTTYWAYFFRGDPSDMRSARFLATERSGTALLTAEGGSTTGVNCFNGTIEGQTASGTASAVSATGTTSSAMTYEIGGSGGTLTYMGQEWVPAPAEYASTAEGFLSQCRTVG